MEAFVYRDGVDVPRDMTRVVVHRSVSVFPPQVFYRCNKLEEVQLNEGLEEIGDEAFWGCVSLRRLNCPSTVVQIGDRAFWGCINLEEVQLNEGLKSIGKGAFYNCVSLRRFSCPSTVLLIGNDVFAYCKKLEEVQLNEGLKEIGYEAFYGCRSLSYRYLSLRGLRCPSTLVWMGYCVLCMLALREIMGGASCWHCAILWVVHLAVILELEGSAFADVQSRIQIPSRAFVLQQRNVVQQYTCRLVTDGTISPTIDEFVLIAPGCLTLLPESNLTELGNSIHAIVNNGEGTEEDRLDRVRQEVRKEVRGEVSAILGLAFWKVKIDEAEQAPMGSTQEAREGCRGEAEGKGKVIAQNVLPFLDSLWGNGS